MPGRRRARSEVLHQNNDAFRVLTRTDADALDMQLNLTSTAIHGIDLSVHALIAVPHQRSDRLLELLDGQTDVESEEVPAVHFVGTKAPQVRSHIVPQLDLQLLVQDDDRER